MRRYRKEHQWRRRPPGLILTLRCESVGATGLDTLVVHAVNDVDYAVGILGSVSAANAISRPPGEYGRKVETQMN